MGEFKTSRAAPAEPLMPEDFDTIDDYVAELKRRLVQCNDRRRHAAVIIRKALQPIVDKADGEVVGYTMRALSASDTEKLMHYTGAFSPTGPSDGDPKGETNQDRLRRLRAEWGDTGKAHPFKRSYKGI